MKTVLETVGTIIGCDVVIFLVWLSNYPSRWWCHHHLFGSPSFSRPTSDNLTQGQLQQWNLWRVVRRAKSEGRRWRWKYDFMLVREYKEPTICAQVCISFYKQRKSSQPLVRSSLIQQHLSNHQKEFISSEQSGSSSLGLAQYFDIPLFAYCLVG